MKAKKPVKKQPVVTNLFGEIEQGNKGKSNFVSTKEKVNERSRIDTESLGITSISDFGEWIKNNRGNKV